MAWLEVLLPQPAHPAVLVGGAAFLFLVLTYLGYPLAVQARALLLPRPLRLDAERELPRVSCVVAAHDEGEALVEKVRGLLELDYPPERLEVVVADDGSSDGSPARAGALEPSRVRVASTPAHLGKPSAVAQAVRLARGEILLLCDVRQRFDPLAARALVRPFRDPSVGAVTGQLRLDGAEGPGAYWRYETAIRTAEGRSGSVVGATGAIYAVRRELFPELPPETILDDVYVPMTAVLRGWRVAYAEDAVAWDRELDVRREFRRKVRTLAGNYQLLLLLPAVMGPANPILWRFLWHKVARLLAPPALAAALVATAASPGLLPRLLLAAQLWCYGLAAVAHLRPASSGRLARLCHTFVALNAAAVCGLWLLARGRARVAWNQTSTLGGGC